MKPTKSELEEFGKLCAETQSEAEWLIDSLKADRYKGWVGWILWVCDWIKGRGDV